MLEKFRRNLLIMLTIFSLVIILCLSFIDMYRMNRQLTQDYTEKIELAEMNVINAIKNLNNDYFRLDQQLADKMRDSSEILLKKYEENNHFDEWDFEELKEQFGMDVYIINKNNQVIYSSFSKDIGLDFEECSPSFAKLLDERRTNGKFIHDGIDLQNDVGELKKYSYMPTKDSQYILELSYELGKDPTFQQYDFVTVMNELKKNYNFIDSVSIFNKDSYEINKSAIEESLIDGDNINDLEWVNKAPTIKDENYLFLKYPVYNNPEKSTMELVKIVYNHDDMQEVLRNNNITFFVQFFSTLVLALSVVIIIIKIIEKPMYLAFHDQLTGLKNRAAFENEMNQLLVKSQKSFGLLLLDLDNFKRVNDTLGHDQGDVLLKYVSTYIKVYLPEKAFFARFGGDEFIILLKDIHDKQELEQLANFIIHSFHHSYLDEHHSHSILFAEGIQIMKSKNVTVSIGGAVYPNDGVDVDTLYKRADLALYYAKEHGKNKYIYYGDSTSD